MKQMEGDQEARALIETCGPGGSPVEIMRTTENGLDWERLAAYSVLHSVLPLLFLRVEEAPALLPSSWVHSLATLYRQHAKHCLRLSAELVGLTRLLKHNGIDCIPLKGPVLAHELYGDCTARQFTDLDILVRKDQVVELSTLLVSRGFRSRDYYSPQQFKQHLKRTCEISFLLPTSGLLLDVHWRTMATYMGADLDPHELFSERTTVQFEGEEMCRLSDDHYLLYLAVHGTFHRWDRLVWIADFARMAAKQASPGWGRLLERATLSGIRRMLLTGLAIVEKLGYLRLEPEIDEAVKRDKTAARLADRVIRDLFAFKEPTIQRTNSFFFKSQQSNGRRLRFAGTRLFVPTCADWERFNLPDRLYFLYYLVRPIRILSECCRETVAVARGPFKDTSTDHACETHVAASGSGDNRRGTGEP